MIRHLRVHTLPQIPRIGLPGCPFQICRPTAADNGLLWVPILTFRQIYSHQTPLVVHLSDFPAFVVTLAEVEVVHLERVQFGKLAMR